MASQGGSEEIYKNNGPRASHNMMDNGRNLSQSDMTSSLNSSGECLILWVEIPLIVGITRLCCNRGRF